MKRCFMFDFTVRSVDRTIIGDKYEKNDSFRGALCSGRHGFRG